MRFLRCTIFLLTGVLALSGCGGSGEEMSVAPASGKVTFNSRPVTNASVMFTPVAADSGENAMTGKSASGEVGADGGFTLSTYAPEDGAIIGKHRVTVMANDPAHPLPGKLPANYEVEVTADGDNAFEISLQ